MREKRSCGLIGGLVALMAIGCGGRSQSAPENPPPSEGGASSSGGASMVAGADNAGGGAAGASTTCPEQMPMQGDRCNYRIGSYCNYQIDHCSSVDFECFDHIWLRVPQADGAAYDCNSFAPPNAPKDGEPCECMGALDCSYSDCKGRGQIHAVCDDTSWSVKEAPCARRPCGPNGLSCDADQVCVAHSRFSTVFSCEPNPCGAASTSCACAASLCESFEVCGLDSGSVVCSCPTC